MFKKFSFCKCQTLNNYDKRIKTTGLKLLVELHFTTSDFCQILTAFTKQDTILLEIRKGQNRNNLNGKKLLYFQLIWIANYLRTEQLKNENLKRFKQKLSHLKYNIRDSSFIEIQMNQLLIKLIIFVLIRKQTNKLFIKLNANLYKFICFT